jgi:hypothetical protein
VDRLAFDIWADSPDHNEELLKMAFAENLCRYQDVFCLNKATELFQTIPPLYFIDPSNPGNVNPLTTNLRAIVYKYHLQNTYNFNDWFEIYDFYGITNDLAEREYAAEALCNTRLSWIFDL